MPYTPQLVSNFGGGLNLRDKADTVAPGQAIDALNVFFTERGSVTQRPGIGALNATALGTAPKGLLSYVRTSTSDRQLLVGGVGEVNVFNSSGSVVSGGTLDKTSTQTISFSATGGTFTLTYSGQTTSAIAYNATAATVQTALTGLSTIGSGNATVTKQSNGNYTVVLGGSLTSTTIAEITASGASLTGGSTTVTVTTTIAQITGGSNPWTFERFGSPGNEYGYAGNGYDAVYRWNGSAWSSPSGMPKAGLLSVVNTPSSTSGLAPRMAAAGFTTATGGPGGTTTNPSYIHFSNAGTAESWTSSNYVQLSPGDGEKIAALVAWRGFIFAFKQSKFFVFYGENLDSSGNPVFNYRAVDVGEGVSGPYAVVAGRDAVYFANENGVFRTTGQDVQKVSDPVDPIFSGDTADYWKGGTLARNKTADMALGFHGDLLYVGYSSGGSYNDRTLVYDTEQKWWSLYDFPASSFGTFKVSNDTELVFTRATTSNQVIRHNASYTNDLGSAISARWRSGWTDFGVNSTKVIRESKVWGAGKCYFAQTADYDTSVGVSQAVDFQQAALTTWDGSTWGGGLWEYPVALVQRMVRLASRGTVFSMVFTNSELNKTFQISRIQHHLRATRIPSVRDTENLT